MMSGSAHSEGTSLQFHHGSSHQRVIYDGKRMRKPIQRKTVDYNSLIIHYLEVFSNLIPLFQLIFYFIFTPIENKKKKKHSRA